MVMISCGGNACQGETNLKPLTILTIRAMNTWPNTEVCRE